ncbi:MAG TPA: hypothetical protein EYP39_08515 [Ghiorsea sp.]|nr:hypothetical protein [Ghiorsea sp.]HIP07547.1 hypothetical protein [Mariprofundaceae bacterium]
MNVAQRILGRFGWQLTKSNASIGRACKGMGLGEAYANQWQGVPCTFVLSTGRVGTETLTTLLNLSDDIVAEHEPFPRLTKTSFDAYMQDTSVLPKTDWGKIILAARDDIIINATRQSKIYIESSNRLTYMVNALVEVFPDSKFIHLHRHPYDVIRSGMRRGFYQNHPWDFCRIKPRQDDPVAADWSHFSPLEKVAWYWASINEESLSFLGKLDEKRGLTLTSEALFNGDSEMLRTLFDFVGAREPASVDVKRVLRLKCNAQLSGDFPNCDAWSDHQRKQVNAIVGKVAHRLGYTLLE